MNNVDSVGISRYHIFHLKMAANKNELVEKKKSKGKKEKRFFFLPQRKSETIVDECEMDKSFHFAGSIFSL